MFTCTRILFRERHTYLEYCAANVDQGDDGQVDVEEDLLPFVRIHAPENDDGEENHDLRNLYDDKLLNFGVSSLF